MKSRSKRIDAMFRVDHGASAPTPSQDAWANEKAAEKQERAAKRAKQKKTKAKRSKLAARKLEKGGLGTLNVCLLLDELTLDEDVRYLSFLLTDGETGRYYNFERMRLRSIGIERRRNGRMKGLRAWFDTEGIHLRWGEHGGMDLRGTSGVVTDPRTIVVTFLTGKTVETAA